VERGDDLVEQSPRILVITKNFSAQMLIADTSGGLCVIVELSFGDEIQSCRNYTVSGKKRPPKHVKITMNRGR